MIGLSFSRILILGTILLILHTGTISAQQTDSSPTLYQIASLDVFGTGKYSGVVTVNEFKEQGTLGMGGSEDLKGELIQLDGKVWQITNEGVVSELSGDEEICLGSTIRFEPSLSLSLNKSLENEEFLSVINGSFPDHDIPYAYRVDGEFTKMEVRSIPPQDEPYIPFSEVLKDQTTFHLSDVNGTICGFWFPAWMKGVNYAGYHQHFITEDHLAGGHILNVTSKNVTLSIQPVHRFTVILPGEKE